MSSKVVRIETTEPIKRNVDDSSAKDATGTREATDVAQYESGTAQTFDAGLTNNVVNLGNQLFAIHYTSHSLTHLYQSRHLSSI